MEEVKKTGLTLQQAKVFADAAIADVKNGFISTGYYLKVIRDEKLWKEYAYASFDAFLNVNYEKDKSWASRCVSLYEKFGIEVSPGELPKLDPEYTDYNVSQLIEMISLPEEKRELVTPETPVRAIRELKPKREKKVATVATPEPEEAQDPEPENSQDRAAYVKEQYRLQESFLYPFAVWLIKNHRQWFEEDHMNRVLCVDKSEPQLKSYLGAYPDGSSSYGFPVAGETHYAKLYDNRIVISHFTDGGTVVVDGTAKWFYLAASVQVQWNVVALEEAQEEEKEDQVIDHFLDRNESIDDAYGWFRSEMVHEYLKTGYKDPNEECEITVLGNVHRVLKGKDVTMFHDISGIAAFDVENGRLEREYNYFFGNRDVAESESKEPENVIEGPKNVPEQSGSVPETPENVIDGKYVEVPPEPEPVKPELPVLKNNDQRAAFVDAYETWPLWIETEETGERYYRYDLTDGTSMVVKVYHAMLFDYNAARSQDRYREGYGRHEYYLLQEGKFFRNCEANRSYLIEKLKEIQKKGKSEKHVEDKNCIQR